ncbi:MAG: polysaccharide biosynthesis tyrosine autokinase [Deltaproteobacteria bacterium]|nr:polysaccharide biosynthesis tyrosine autokinase [Deltaproteobacteria bacterium]
MRFQFEEGAHIADFVSILLRRWRFVLACAAGVLAVAWLLTWKQQAVYRATSRIIMGQTLVRALLPEQTNPYESYFAERLSFETQIHVIKSDPVAERVVGRLKLAPDDASPEALRGAAMRVKNSIMVDRIPDTRLFDINVVGPNAELASSIANTVAEVYIEMNQERKLETTRRSVAWLTEELATLEGKIRGLDEELIDYLQETNIDPTTGLASDSGAGRGEEGMASQTSTVQALSNQLAAAEMELNGLLQRYLDKHPKVVAKRTEVETLRGKISEDMVENSAQNKQLIQYNIKRRESELNKEMMILLMKKLKEMDLTGGLADNNVSIVEYAQIPSRPISPNTRRNITIGGLLGVLLGIGLVLYLEIFDRTVQTPEDAERFLKTPVLASIIQLDEKDRLGNPFLISAQHPSSPESEMFRTLRTNLKFSRPDGVPKTLLVTSTGPEEGKSTVSANLGITLASGMKRTVLVDSDFRKPRLHKVFGLKNGKGMVEVLVGESELDEVIQPTAIKNLFVIPRGSLPPNPAELLDSDRLREVLKQLHERFDYVVLDSPPIGSVIDASILAGLVDGTVLVVEAGKFEWRPIQRAKEQIEKSQGRILGVVINKSRRERLGYYYQYQQYASGQETAQQPGAAV